MMPNNLKLLMETWFDTKFKGVLKRQWISCFFAVIWLVWKVRNKIIFENGVADRRQLLEQIRFYGKSWALGKYKYNSSHQLSARGSIRLGQEVATSNQNSVSQPVQDWSKKICWLSVDFMHERNQYAIGGYMVKPEMTSLRLLVDFKD